MSEQPPAKPGVLASAFAWMSGAAFVASLGYFTFCYMVRLERPAAVTNKPASALTANLLIFSGFALHHSIMARSGAKAYIKRLIDPRLERATYVLTASVLFYLVCREWKRLPGEQFRQRGLWASAHRAVQAAGIVLVALSTRRLDPLALSGIRQAVGAGAPPAAVDGPEEPGLPPRPFTDDGPYGWVRHPIYLGWMLFVFGTPRMTTDRFVFAGISTAYLMVAAPFEERSLLREHGGAYRQYMERVPWRMLPWVY
jgi:methanethiol S-methyltransferase